MKANDGTGSSPSRRKTAWPSEAMPSARSRAAAGSTPAPAIAAAAPSRSAPAARMNGLPVTPTAAISPAAARASAASSAAFSDSSPCGPKVFGLVWSCPLSSVISASTPALGPRSTSRTIALVTTSPGKLSAEGRMPLTFGMFISLDPLPQHGAAHAHADAHGGEPVADLGVLSELRGELDHQPDAGRGERVADGDRAAPRVHPRVVVGDLEVVEEREHLDRERLVDLDEADVVHGQPLPGEQLLGGGHGADAHDLGLDSGELEVHQAHLGRQAELGGGLL